MKPNTTQDLIKLVSSQVPRIVDELPPNIRLFEFGHGYGDHTHRYFVEDGKGNYLAYLWRPTHDPNAAFKYGFVAFRLDMISAETPPSTLFYIIKDSIKKAAIEFQRHLEIVKESL